MFCQKSKIMRAKVGNSCSFLAVKSNVISIITVAAFATMMLSTLAILSIVSFGNSKSLTHFHSYFINFLFTGTCAGSSWSYKGESSPDFWSDNFPICGSDSQSPIDLSTDSESKI